MYPYMIGSPEVGAYKTAFEYSLRAFRAREPADMAKTSGCRYDPRLQAFTLVSLGQPISVSFPEGVVLFQGTEISPRWEWRLLALNYLWRSDGTPPTGETVSFRQLKDGRVFYQAFEKTGIAELISSLAGTTVNADKVKEACLALGGKLEKSTGYQASFPLLPLFPVTIKIWTGDEEIPGGANILCDASATHHLHIEDVYAAGYAVAWFLVQHYKMLVNQG